MKNNKGITMISLVIVVLLMLLLASITVYESNDLIATARVQSVTTNLLLIQAQIRIINEKIVFDNSEENINTIIKGTKLSLETNIRYQNDTRGIIPNDADKDKYYVLSQIDLNDMGLEDLNAEDGYIVNYETEEVIYVKGVKNAKKECLYRLQGATLVP